MRISEIYLYYSEMQLELSEIGLNYLKFIWKRLKLTWIIWNSLGYFRNWPEKGVMHVYNSYQNEGVQVLSGLHPFSWGLTVFSNR